MCTAREQQTREKVNAHIYLCMYVCRGAIHRQRQKLTGKENRDQQYRPVSYVGR